MFLGNTAGGTNAMSNNSISISPLSSSNLVHVNNSSSGNLNSVGQQATSGSSIVHNKKPSQSSLVLNSTTNNNNSSQSNMLANNAETNGGADDSELQIEDIEIMKQRSANNNTFLCIKIPEIQLLVSYRGSNRDKKNIKDLTEVSLLFPLFEVHDKTWTWLDLINALKSHVKKALVSQVTLYFTSIFTLKESLFDLKLVVLKALKHKLIKVPIKPVNRLINLRRRSTSNTNQLKLNDESEKLTISKLFGVKFIESKTKQSHHPKLNTSSQQQRGNKKVMSSFERSNNNMSDSEEAKLAKEDEDFFDQDIMVENRPPPQPPASIISTTTSRPVATVKKSHSTLSSDLKRRFLKFTKDKSSSSSSSVVVPNPNTSNNNTNASPSQTESNSQTKRRSIPR